MNEIINIKTTKKNSLYIWQSWDDCFIEKFSASSYRWNHEYKKISQHTWQSHIWLFHWEVFCFLSYGWNYEYQNC